MIFEFERSSRGIDGLDHINVYSQAETMLGQQLSNFYESDCYYKDIKFSSVEAFWYWWITAKCHDDLKTLSGIDAKRIGKKYLVLDEPPSEEILREVYLSKLKNNKRLVKELRNSTLPFAHYYVYRDAKVNADRYLWTVKIWDDIRNELQSGVLVI
jgi:hypothetical protein